MFWLFKLISWNFLRAGAERQHFSWLLVTQKGYKLLIAFYKVKQVHTKKHKQWESFY